MKKSTLLSLATAGAIVVTSAGTFAVWDTLKVTSTGTITVDNPSVTLSTTTELGVMSADNQNTIGDIDPVYNGDVEFKVVGVDKISSLETVTVVKKDGVALDSNRYTVNEGSSSVTKPAEGASVNVPVKITILDETLAGADLSVETTVTATPAP